MKKEILEISPKYIVDETGKKTEVFLDVSNFEQMLEKLEDLYFALKAEEAMKDSEFIDLDESKKNFIRK